MDLFMFVLEEAEKNGLGIDMATGTGWPFGGPWVTQDDACKYFTYKTYELNEGESIQNKIEYIQKPFVRSIGKKVSINHIQNPISKNDSLQEIAFEQVRFEKPMKLVALMAFSNGVSKDLMNNIKDGYLDWNAPTGKWKIYAVFMGWHGKMVERAAPGGEGDVIDHFDRKALENYLKHFENIFKHKNSKKLRAFFNDSYEVDDAWGEANFTPTLFEDFKIRRGYDLKEYLPALLGEDTINNINVRVKNDYRLTISELLLENFTQTWREWSKKNNKIIRNQAHGSPANILDLYEASDIPETESEDILKIKFASSASNVSGKNLTSSESATWLDEHFFTTLEMTRENLDRFFLGGVNHVFYHGTTYSPSDVSWPGFMFYASVHFAPTNTFWDDFKALNHYVARCQSLLQTGEPDNEILVYFPFFDRLAFPEKAMLHHFRGEGLRNQTTPFRELISSLMSEGFSLDYISDKMILDSRVKRNEIKTKGNNYKLLIVPECKYIPENTLVHLLKLAKQGAKIIFIKEIPTLVPGLYHYVEQESHLKNLVDQLDLNEVKNQTFKISETGDGLTMVGDNVFEMLDHINIDAESLTKSDLSFLRRKTENGKIYFIVNKGDQVYNSWVNLNVNAESVMIMNPMNDLTGKALMKKNKEHISVFLQLNPGQSIILQTFDDEVENEIYPYYRENSEILAINGPWMLDFVKGGPTLPYTKSMTNLYSWTELGTDDVRNFSGTCKYSTTITKPENYAAEAWILDLGVVHESAQVLLNGEILGTLFCPPYQIVIEHDKFLKENKLEVYVSNLMINRIIDMENNNIPYKNFYDVNFPSRKSEHRGEDGLFTAKNMKPLPSGLVGPVYLRGINFIEP